MRGARVVHDSLLNADAGTDVAVLVVWSRVLDRDGRQAAEDLAAELGDAGARFFWDPGGDVGTALAPRLELGAALAWDVYCFFDRDAHWDDAVPPVARWAHQLAGADPAHYFGPELDETLRSWSRELAGGPTSAVQPAPVPENVIMIRPQDLETLPVVLLDQVLDDLGREKIAGADRAALERIAVQLRRRMVEAAAPHADQVPKAIRHDGKVLIVPPSRCAPPTGDDAGGQ